MNVIGKYSRRWTIGAVATLTLLGQAGRKPIFVSAQQLDIASVLPDPPANDSAQTTKELAELHRMQETRSAEQIAHAKGDDVEEDIFIFKDVLGNKFAKSELPLTAVLSAHVHSDEGVIVGPAKKYFKRPRPFNFDHTIKPVCRTNNDLTDYAYPSGHSTTGYLEALVLTMMVPEKRDAILIRADDYAHSRLICGVHYPTDVAASKFVAYAMIGIMMDNPQFKQEFDAAKAETRRALGLS